MRREPPRLARLLVKLAARPGNRGPVVYDLREEFDAMLAEGVPLDRARRWYWRQVIASLVPLLATRRARAGLPRGRWGMEGGGVRDVKVGVRMLVKRPGFSLIVVATLALGIGATSAVFSLIQGVLLTPPPYRNPDRLTLLTPEYLDDREGEPPGWAADQWLDWREETSEFESIAAYMWAFNFLVSDDGSRSLQGMRVSRNYFQTLGIQPVLGRVFDVTETNGEAIILGYDLWMGQFDGNPDVLGQPFRMSRMADPPIVIGVMPPGVRFLPYARAAQEPGYDVDATVDFWLPAEVTRASPPEMREARAWSLVGRMAGRVTPAAARAELNRLAAGQGEANSQYEGIGVRVEPVIEVANRDGRRILLPLLAAAVLVLLIACGNAAALLLVRGLQRQQEYGVRSALGAGRGALVRLVAVESFILALAGGTLGVGLALGIVHGFKLLAGHAVPRLDAVSAGWPVLFVGLGSGLVATVVAGLYPAIRASRNSAASTLATSTARTTAGRGERRVLTGLTMLQAALTLTLLVGAGLLIRSMSNLARVDTGYDLDHVLTMSVTHVAPGWEDFHRRALQSVSAIPGVQRAAFAWGVPLTGNNWPARIRIEGRVAPGGSDEPLSLPLRSVTADYFALLGERILEGRSFRRSDDRQGARVAIVNQTFVERYLDGGPALGRKLIMRPSDPRLEIVGVVSDSRTDDLTEPAQPEIYLSLWQAGAYSKHLVLRTARDPEAMAGEVQRVLREVEPTVAVEDIRTLDQIRSESVASRSFAMQLLVAFAIVACVLTLGGIYGLLSLSVASRRREIAIRTAVGAGRRNVLQLVMREGMAVIGVGIVVGLLAAAALSRVLGAFLFGVRPADPLTLAAMAALFGGVAVLACVLPARRAVKVDPVRALREE